MAGCMAQAHWKRRDFEAGSFVRTLETQLAYGPTNLLIFRQAGRQGMY